MIELNRVYKGIDTLPLHDCDPFIPYIVVEIDKNNDLAKLIYVSGLKTESKLSHLERYLGSHIEAL